MNPETLTKLNDQELTQVIAAAQGLLQTRAEKRKSDAMQQIRRIAATAQITVSFDAARKPKGGKAPMRAGERYVNPAEASQSYVVGKGKPPNWFAALRDKGRLPAPVVPDSPKEV
jgi:hypothetical protein